ncbi:oxygenase MpaB family protein [Streptomyces sp. NBC_01497]|uniref:oxygenase MpaB family protein n=1 Tax=Streptomyces sp. NBC_01497 TaxID=2903885 RepID=UPI002E3112E9|nr:oxygenase MpaB family protein [Streptomyces sp. NBC_01497]
MDERDPGLFGPASVTWQTHSDPAMWIAGIRALYLQALHPRAVRGVMQNSDFREDTWGRLLRTARFVATVTYGTTPAAEEAGARIRGIHRRLKATDPGTGERYGVDEPELLLWVHCAEIDSYLDVTRRSGLPLDGAAADRYVAEQRHSARLVGLDPADVPATTAELAAYFTRVLPDLACGPEAREVDDFLRRPPVPGPLTPARAVLWSRVASLAYDALPHFAHVAYGRPAPAPEAVDRRLRIAGNLLRLIPSTVRWQLPPKHILRAVARLGPGTRPDPYSPRRRPAILERPGGEKRSDGGDSGPWPTPG